MAKGGMHLLTVAQYRLIGPKEVSWETISLENSHDFK